MIVLDLVPKKENMTDKIVNIFNKQPVNNEAEVDNSVEELFKELEELRPKVKEIITIIIDHEDNMITRSSNMTRESAYFVLSLARNDALYG